MSILHLSKMASVVGKLVQVRGGSSWDDEDFKYTDIPTQILRGEGLPETPIHKGLSVVLMPNRSVSPAIGLSRTGIQLSVRSKLKKDKNGLADPDTHRG